MKKLLPLSLLWGTLSAQEEAPTESSNRMPVTRGTVKLGEQVIKVAPGMK